MSLHLTASEEELVREHRMKIKIDRAYNLGLEHAAQKADEWAAEGAGIVMENFARSVRLMMKPERINL